MATLAEIQSQHPDWHVVALVDQPGGGQLAVGADGGVFNLGAGTFYGSIPGLENDTLRGQHTITAGGVSTNAAGGYTLTDVFGRAYAFGPQAAAAAAPSTATPAAPTGAINPQSPESQSAKGLIASSLTAVGLPASLVDTLWNDNYLKQGQPFEYIRDVVLPSTDAFKQKFPAFSHFQQSTGGTVGDYITTVNSYKGAMRAAGLSDVFDDNITHWINGDVSPKEVSDRIQLASQAALTAPPEVRDFLINQEGLSPGDLTGYFLDQDKGDLVKAQARYQQAEIGGAAARQGFGSLSLAEAQQLQQAGVTGDQATQRFGALGQESALFQATAGEAMTGTGVGRDVALAAAANTGDALKQIDTARKRRQAAFEGGGGAASGGGGRQGLGSS